MCSQVAYFVGADSAARAGAACFACLARNLRLQSITFAVGEHNTLSAALHWPSSVQCSSVDSGELYPVQLRSARARYSQ
jgi:hypothetical protein